MSFWSAEMDEVIKTRGYFSFPLSGKKSFGTIPEKFDKN